MKWFKRFKRNNQKKRRGVLTLEWILLVTVVVIGIIGGLGAVRNAMIGELQDLAEMIESLNIKTEAECSAESGGTMTCEQLEAAAEGGGS